MLSFLNETGYTIIFISDKERWLNYMNLEKLFLLQKELDTKIRKQRTLEDRPLLQKKLLALQVELGELANETRCFKYWSDKGPSDKEVILEEYVDCLHFILSVGLEKGYEDIKPELKHIESPLTDQFLTLYIDVNDFIICSSKDHYITLFEDFLNLGISLNFTIEDIEDSYLRKNSTNHKRQANGY
jgi:dimeric dUTPase (all-alpha-NTP-PPase superfamily)